MLNVCFDECAFGAMRFGLREESTYSYYALCYGPIQPDIFDETRKLRVDRIYRSCSKRERNKIVKEEKKRFDYILDTAKKQKELRIWIANNAGDKCGIYHIVHALQGFDCKVFVVEMPSNIGFREPEWEKAWGEAEPEDFIACLHLARELSEAERENMAQKWEKLVAENSTLRVMIDGEVASVPTDYLDNEILSFAPTDKEFKAGYLVGIALGHMAHFITCGYAEWRVEKLVEQGKLTVVYSDSDPKLWNMMILRRS